jgi:hypothetical protein
VAADDSRDLLLRVPLEFEAPKFFMISLTFSFCKKNGNLLYCIASATQRETTRRENAKGRTLAEHEGVGGTLVFVFLAGLASWFLCRFSARSHAL